MSNVLLLQASSAIGGSCSVELHAISITELCSLSWQRAMGHAESDVLICTGMWGDMSTCLLPPVKCICPVVNKISHNL